jgi:solute carrier family 25 phosphate transporter 23/24/25/41
VSGGFGRGGLVRGGGWRFDDSEGNCACGCFVFREVLGLVKEEAGEDEEKKKPRKMVLKGFKVKVGNASLRRLISGAIAGAVSSTAVAPLETIRTHLMVGSGGNKTSVEGMFQTIMERDGWQGLFRGNGVNVLRVAPSKAIEVRGGF